MTWMLRGFMLGSKQWEGFQDIMKNLRIARRMGLIGGKSLTATNKDGR